MRYLMPRMQHAGDTYTPPRARPGAGKQTRPLEIRHEHRLVWGEPEHACRLRVSFVYTFSHAAPTWRCLDIECEVRDLA